MSKAEILSELPKLKPEDRREVLQCLWDLEERDLLNGVGPSADEKALLDREHEEFEQSPDAGTPWSEAKARLSNRSPR